MKAKYLLFTTMSLLSVASIAGCGVNPGHNPEGAKLTVKDSDGDYEINLGKTGKATAYIILDMPNTDLKSYQPHEISFTTDNNEKVKVTTGSINDFKPEECYWVATFSAVGQYKVTAHLAGETFNSLTYTVNAAKAIDFEYKVPTATNFSYIIHSEGYQNDIKIYKIGDNYLKQLNESHIVFFKKKSGKNYSRYAYDTNTQTWGQPRDTTEDRVLNVVFSESTPTLPDYYDLKTTGEVTIKTTTASGSEDKKYDCTTYKSGTDTYDLVACTEFSLCVHSIVDNGRFISDTKIMEINYTISTFPMDVPVE